MQLGPFELDRVVGRGGMATVWRAEHLGSRTAVAVKVMAPELTRDDAYVEGLLAEVRAVARLRHPGIVPVLDLGVVSDAAAAASGGQLHGGSPWYAMQYVPGGTLHDLPQKLEWSQLRSVLLAVLDALAHSHARGVIHRDLKPPNILVSTDRGRLQPMLADFGIARTTGAGNTIADRDKEKVTGTPKYMAPEQIVGDVRDQGPWTDLYALGCIAFQLLAGRPPFVGQTVYQVLEGHLSRPVPPLDTTGYPEELDGWIRRMLHKEPGRRFQAAADAAWGLWQLPAEADDTIRVVVRGETLSAPERVAFAERTWILAADATPRPLSRPDTAGFSSPETLMPSDPMLAMRPPIPPTWRRETVPPLDRKLAGAGLGLYALRKAPFTGRKAERDALWGQLVDVHRSGRLRGVAVHGGAGTGKSRLVEWVLQRANEVGAARSLTIRHSPVPGPRDGIEGTLASWYGVIGSQGPEALERLASVQARFGDTEVGGVSREDPPVLDPRQKHDVLTLLSLFTIAGLVEADPVWAKKVGLFPAVSRQERTIVISRLMRQLASQRPLIVFADDVQWGIDTLELFGHLLEASDDVPLLLVMVARDDELVGAPQPPEGGVPGNWAALASSDTFSDLEVGPLPENEHFELVRSLLGFDDVLSRQIARRTVGNPTFAVQLVGDWVERGLLKLGARGFELATDEQPPLPENLQEVWATRLEQAVATLAPEDQDAAWNALEVAAALGSRVSMGDWAQLARIPAGLGDALAGRHLAFWADNAFTFAHGMVREALVLRAKQGHRWMHHNRECAEVFAERYPDRRGLPPTTAMVVEERLGHFWAEAGEWDVAEQCLGRAAFAALDLFRPHRAMAIAETWGRILQRLETPEDHPSSIRHRLVKGWTETIFGSAAAAREMARPIVEEARQTDDLDLLGHALQLLADTTRAQSVTEAVKVYEEAVDVFGRGGYERHQAHTLLSLAYARIRVTQWELAERELRLGLETVEKLQELPMISEYNRILANLYLTLGRVDEARACIEDAKAAARRSGSRASLGNVLLEAGNVERGAEDFAAAIAAYEECLETYGTESAWGPKWAALGLGLTYVQLSEFDAARDWFARVEAAVDEAQRQSYGWFGQLELGIAACYASFGNWTEFDRYVDLAQGCTERDRADHDIVRMADLVAAMTRNAGHPERAVRLEEIASHQRQALGGLNGPPVSEH